MKPHDNRRGVPMRCMFINRSYWPDFQATGQLLTELCEHLADRWDVTAVTGQPVYLSAEPKEFETHGCEFRNGVRMERLAHVHVSAKRVRWRIANLASFTLAARKWLRKTKQRPDVLVCETDPFFLPLIAAPAAKRFGCKLVFYLQDIYPDIAISLGMMQENLVSHMLRKRLKKAYLQADKIVVLGDDMRDHLTQWGVPIEKIEIVPNWVDCKAVYPAQANNRFRHQHGLEDRFVVMHSGNMGMTQRLGRLLDASLHPDIPDDTVFALVGNGGRRPELAERLEASPANGELRRRVRLFDYQAKEDLADSLSAADLHVISMDERITGLMAPSKLYGILASGSPVLAIVPPSCEVWRIVEREGIGWCVRPGDTDGIVAAIRDAAAMTAEQRERMGAKARQLAELSYDRQICCQQFESLIQHLVNVDGRSSLAGGKGVLVDLGSSDGVAAGV